MKDHDDRRSGSLQRVSQDKKEYIYSALDQMKWSSVFVASFASLYLDKDNDGIKMQPNTFVVSGFFDSCEAET